MNVRLTSLDGVVVIEGAARVDARGSFLRAFCVRELEGFLGDRSIVQVNVSVTRRRGAVRGLHFQRPPAAEMKFVRCLRGRVFDVAVDLRAGSPTLLRAHGEELAAGDGRMVVVPEGCAHGFQSLEPESELLYLHTAAYAPAFEDGLDPRDPRLDIPWPLPISELSSRDQAHPALPAGYSGIVLKGAA